MKKYYDNLEDNVAFERCIDVMTKMILRHGPQVLKQLEQNSSEGRVDDKSVSDEKVS